LAPGSLTRHVFRKFSPNLTVNQVLSGPLDFDKDAHVSQKKVDTAGATKVRGIPRFCADIVKLDQEQGVHQVLNVILVIDLKRRAGLPAPTQLSRDYVKAPTDSLHGQQR
jgi:hypothetical protein